MKKRFLTGIFMIEAMEARFNTSHPDAETKMVGENGNITYTKKVDGKGSCSSNCIKSNMKKFYIENGFSVSQYIKIKQNQSSSDCNPVVNINEDMFGMMSAGNEELDEKQYEELNDEQKKLYKRAKGKTVKYSKNITKKRVGRFHVSPLIGLGLSKVKKEFNVCKTVSGETILYTTEKYSDLMVSSFGINVNEVGKFTISDNANEYRDYSLDESDIFVDELSKEERFKRIEVTLQAINFLSIESNQSNNYADAMPKAVILGEFGLPNVAFQGVISKGGIDVEVLKERLDRMEDYRLGKIYIGLDKGIMAESFNTDREQLKKELEGYDVEVTTVGKAFKGYVEYLEKTLV